MTCQAHPVLVKKANQVCGSFFLIFLSRWRIPDPMSCRCPEPRVGLLETPPRWHMTIYMACRLIGLWPMDLVFMSTFDNQSTSIGCVSKLRHLFGFLRHYLLILNFQVACHLANRFILTQFKHARDQKPVYWSLPFSNQC